MDTERTEPSTVTIETMEELARRMAGLELRPSNASASTSAHGVSPSPFIPLVLSSPALEVLKDQLGHTEGDSMHQSGKLPAITPPVFDGSDFDNFCTQFVRFMRLTGLLQANSVVQVDWVVNCCAPKIRRIAETLAARVTTADALLRELSSVFPQVENTISLRVALQKVPVLSKEPTPSEIEHLILDLEVLFSKFPMNCLSNDEKVLTLVSKLHPNTWKEMRSDKEIRSKCNDYENLKSALREKMRDDLAERFLFTQMQNKTTHRALAMDTPTTPPTSFQQGKGNGKGKGKGNTPQFFGPPQQNLQPYSTYQSNGKGQSFGKGKGKGKGSWKPDRFKARITCKFCGKTNHSESECWSKPKWNQKGGGNPPRKSFTPPERPPLSTWQASSDTPRVNQKRKIDEINLLKAFYLDTRISNKHMNAIIDTGASISAVSRRFVQGGKINSKDAIPIKVGSGEVIYSLGTTEVQVSLGVDTTLTQRCHVVETNAFDCVLGLDFMHSQPVNGLLLKPPRLIVNNQEYLLREDSQIFSVQHCFRMYQTEDYKLRVSVRDQVLLKFSLRPENLEVDLFAGPKNNQVHLFCSKQISAWKFNWRKLTHNAHEGWLWANPPFSKLAKAITKVALEGVRVIMVTPDWGASGQNAYWRQLLDRLTVQRTVLSQIPLYEKYGDANKLLPSPHWSTLVSVLDGSANKVSVDELEPILLKSIKKDTRDWGRDELEKLFGEKSKEFTSVQTPLVPDRFVPTPSEDIPLPKSCSSKSVEAKKIVEMPVTPHSTENTYALQSVDPSFLLAELHSELDLSLTIQPPDQVRNEESLFLFVPNGVHDTMHALPKGKIPISSEDLFAIAKETQQIYPDPSVFVESSSITMESKPDVIQGDFEQEFERFAGEPEVLRELLCRFAHVFGQLPPPSKGQSVIQLDLQLKKEFEGQQLKQKCWNMAKPDMEEIELQAQELVRAGLAEEFVGNDFPTFCSPTMLVDKEKNKSEKTSTSKRMVIDYRKLNKRTILHVGGLPSLEDQIEALAKFRFKCKLDMRSGFWQVSLSSRASDLCSFITPSGRVYKPLVMPFGLSNAPTIFQEMMEKMIALTKKNPKIHDLISKEKGHLAVFFDDTAIGANTEKDCLTILEAFLETCSAHNLRIKLTKCEFLKREMEYLGFVLGHGVWKPSPKKVQALLQAKVTDVKSLRGFLGAANFLRRHVRNFTFSSAPLTNLLRINQRWEWNQECEKALKELKGKIASTNGLGVPRAKGEVVLITDASNIGGGAAVFQWQQVDAETRSFPDSPTPVEALATTGVERDGMLKHNYPVDQWCLVPIGFYNWKWSPARSRYGTYQQEILSGVLTMSSQVRILGHLPIIWLCDQKSTERFLVNEAPQNPRLCRWWVFLSQLRLTVKHVPGIKNELCDYLSRNAFNELIQDDVESLAKSAFQRMDVQLDLCMNTCFVLSWSESEYRNDEIFGEIWDALEEGQSRMIDDVFYWRNESKLFREKKLCIPKCALLSEIHALHQNLGHPGIDKTFWSFVQRFSIPIGSHELKTMIHTLVMSCRICCEAKPQTPNDRNLIGSLPVPELVNQIVYLDFLEVDEFATMNYVLTVVDGLSGFCRFFPCRKNINSEKSFKLLFENWIQVYGRPNEIVSDNDVRFSSPTSFWQQSLKSLGIRITFTQARHPQSNGLCEVTNRKFLQKMRIFLCQSGSRDWLKFLPIVTWTLNNEVRPSIGYTPHELFFGKPTWNPDIPVDPEGTTTIDSWVIQQKEMCEIASREIARSRSKRLRKANAKRKRLEIQEGDYVLIHKKRFPQYTISKLSTQFFGPYKVKKVFHSTALVRTSPKLGGDVEVGFSFLKRFPHALQDHEDDEGGDHNDGAEQSSESEIENTDPIGLISERNTHVHEGHASSSMHETNNTSHTSFQGDESLSRDRAFEPGMELAQTPSVLRPALLRHRPDRPLGEKLSSTLSQQPDVEVEPHTTETFNVEQIIRHRYRQGYQFLTRWEDFSVEESTWEPVRSFVNNGLINSQFLKYAQDHGLQKAITQAHNLSRRQETADL